MLQTFAECRILSWRFSKPPTVLGSFDKRLRPKTMNETDFQALFESYQEGLRVKNENPIPQNLHLMIYNYARLRHQQTSDVSADFYLHVAGKLDGIFERYDQRRIPFYQYLAGTLNFEFSHFLRRRRLPRSQTELLSLDELAERSVQLADQSKDNANDLEILVNRVNPGDRHYAKLALAIPLTFGELRQLTGRKKKQSGAAWSILRAYREFIRFAEDKRRKFLSERDRLIKIMMHLEHETTKAEAKALERLKNRREVARKKFFSMDTHIPIRIVAAVTGDSIATAQRRLKKAVISLKKTYLNWEKTNLVAKRGK
jgi:hypothetical protein